MKTKRLSKKEAAQVLGCAERQLQRYTAAGRLSVEYEHDGKKRKATYSESEVMAFKERLTTPELRGIAVRPLQTTEPASQVGQPTLQTTNLLSLPQSAMQALQMLGASSNIEAGKCVSVEEIKFEKLFIGTNGVTKMTGVSVNRYNMQT